MSAGEQALSPEAGVAVVGAGAMGAGIAQIAALAGHPVLLHDTRAGAAESAITGIRGALERLVGKNKLKSEVVEKAISNLRPATSIADLKGCALVVEAIVESLDAKRALFTQLEAVVSESTVLATNTSSISITAIGAVMARPERLVGMHFFNPAPLMPLVEVIRGAATSREVADIIFATSARWGKTPVHARSTPGFIVNRVARPFYAEGLRLLQEGVADPATLDAVMRESGGFKMGPCELMDLIGHDVNYAVTRSVFDAFYGDSRFQPSLIQLELVNAGYLGRKTGRGFYDYRETNGKVEPSSEPGRPRPPRIEIDGFSPLGEALAARLQARGCPFVVVNGKLADGQVASVDEAAIHLTDGRSATERAATGDDQNLVLVDLMLEPATARRAALSCADQCCPTALISAVGFMQAAGFQVSVLRDSPGMVVMRTVAMLANEACDAVHQQVCNVSATDLAMRGGVGYPMGPLEWADRIGAERVLKVIDGLAHHYGEPRYRASPFLRQRVWAGKELHDE